MHKRTIILTSSTLAACAAAIALLWLVGGGFSAHAALALSTVEGPVEAPADELRVCATCAYQTVQAAVDAAIPGDVIKVAQGTYTGVNVRPRNDVATSGVVTQTVYISKSITIRGGYTTSEWDIPDPAAHPTTLDAQGQGRVLYITGDITFTIEGLRITGGDASGLGGRPGGDNVGGGIYVYAVTAVISGNVVYSNTAGSGNSFGGGLGLYSSDATLNGNAIYSNTASHGGGGCLCGSNDATLSGNTITGNVGRGWGGGLYLASSATLSDNTVSGNTGGNGGGVCLDRGDVTLNGNLVYSNTAHSGGGLYVYISDLAMSDDIVRGNAATGWRGGGLSIYKGSPVLVNTVVADNTLGQATGLGAGIYVVSSSPRLLHTTIARNSGGDGSGICAFFESTVVMTNTIIVSHTVGITVAAGNAVTLNVTLWHANTTNWDGTGTINHTNDHSGDPVFAPDGYHLITGSMAIDRGVNAGVTADVDGDTRPQGAGYDIGADEFPAAPADVAWDKQVRINGGPFQAWDSGPFTVAPGDDVTIVERVWVTATGNVSFTLGEAWTPSLEWVTYEATTGTVSQSGLTATWSVTNATPKAWHILTKTLHAVAVPEYADTLTETLTVQGLAIQLPERIIKFQHPRPQPAWDKTVRVNGGPPRAWDAGPFTVTPGDVVTVVDQVWITYTSGITFTLAQVWGPGLNLDGWDYDAGAVTTGTGRLTWRGTGEPANQWRTLTTTWHVTGTTWLYESVTETLTVEGADPQPPQQVVNLLNLSASTGCYARVNDGSTIYPTVQSAVDAAQPGDLVKVAGCCTDVNHYSGLAQVVYLDKSLTIRGGYTITNWTTPDVAANPTTLDAQGQGRVLYITGDITPTVEGLRITGGDTDVLGGAWDAGGGIYVKNATAAISGNLVYSNTASGCGGGLWLGGSPTTLSGNTVMSNTASQGGGLQLSSSPATLNGNTVIANTASQQGGGLQLSSSPATLSGNTISGNEATGGWGGGLLLASSDATLSGNTITGNIGGYGAGVCLSSSDATLTGNTVSVNSGYRGGGLYLYYSVATLSDTVVTGNTASEGGGLYLWSSASILTNTVVADNQATESGSGLRVDCASAPRLLHTTIARNTGGDGSGVYVTDSGCDYSTVAMTNTIIVSHTVGIAVTAGNAATLNATLWHANTITWSGNVNHTNDYSGDPAFAPDGYHLTSVSAAIDKGVNAGVTADIDGQARPQSLGYDIGADEFVCVALTGVTIGGPTTGTVGTVHTFTATTTPANASLLITYTWSPAPLAGQGSAVVNYTWPITGSQVITVTAENCGGVASDIHTIEVAERYIYLPLVLRGF